MSAWSN